LLPTPLAEAEAEKSARCHAAEKFGFSPLTFGYGLLLCRPDLEGERSAGKQWLTKKQEILR
jgi:hypothetical protein